MGMTNYVWKNYSPVLNSYFIEDNKSDMINEFDKDAYADASISLILKMPLQTNLL